MVVGQHSWLLVAAVLVGAIALAALAMRAELPMSAEPDEASAKAKTMLLGFFEEGLITSEQYVAKLKKLRDEDA